jgi:hypothetical protein
MTRLLIRFLRRLLIFALGVFSIWLIVFVFEFVDDKRSWILALAITYAMAAYVILPRAVRTGLKILQRKHVPSYTITGDGLPGDAHSCSTRPIPRRRSAPFICSGAARTSASRKRSTTARANAITSGSGL